MSIELLMPSNQLTLCHPLLLLPSIFHQNIFQWVGSLETEKSKCFLTWNNIRITINWYKYLLLLYKMVLNILQNKMHQSWNKLCWNFASQMWALSLWYTHPLGDDCLESRRWTGTPQRWWDNRRYISIWVKGLDLAYEGKPCDGLGIQVTRMSSSESFSIYEAAALRTIYKMQERKH